MDKLTVFKRIMKYEISKFPVWGWLTCFLLIILLRHQIANMLGTLLPITAAIAGVFFFIGEKRVAAKIGVFIAYSLFIVAFF